MPFSRRVHARRWLCGIIAGFALTGLGCGDGAELEDTETTESAQTEAWKVLSIQYQVQQTGYWCGPAATRIALSARIQPPSQGALAAQLGTTWNGTDYIGQITGVLNAHLGAGRYQTRNIPNDPPTADQKNQLWLDLVRGIDNNYPIVANIVAPPNNHPPGYPNNETIFHYFALIGYNRATRQVFIADSANFGGHQLYWLPFDQLASLIPPKGYSAWVPQGTTCPGGSGTVLGAINAKYLELGGCGSFLGVPSSEELTAPDKIGRYSVFEHGSIYWSPTTGAHEVHGVVRTAWEETGWEGGPLGYPISDEQKTPDGKGRYNRFESGAIYYTKSTGAHEVYGLIHAKWAELGYEKSELGYPVSGEYATKDGRQSDFEHGSITVDDETKEIEVKMKKRWKLWPF